MILKILMLCKYAYARAGRPGFSGFTVSQNPKAFLDYPNDMINTKIWLEAGARNRPDNDTGFVR